jgi:c-src tyrosine kinase
LLFSSVNLSQVDARALAAWEIPRRAIVRVKPIGSGQFGEVFEGTYAGKQVAIKTLKDVDDESRKLFLAEADVMSYVFPTILSPGCEAEL